MTRKLNQSIPPIIAATLALSLAACAPAAPRPVENPPDVRVPAAPTAAPAARTFPAATAAPAPTKGPDPTKAPEPTKGPAPVAGSESKNQPLPALPAAPVAVPPVAPVPPATYIQPTSGGPRQIDPTNNRAPIEPTSVSPLQLPPADNNFKDYGVNPFVDASRDRLSTFGLDVDTASYNIAKRYIQQGNLPPYQAVRVEEFVNSFKQNYPSPQNAAFGIFLQASLLNIPQNLTVIINLYQGIASLKFEDRLKHFKIIEAHVAKYFNQETIE